MLFRREVLLGVRVDNIELVLAGAGHLLLPLLCPGVVSLLSLLQGLRLGLLARRRPRGDWLDVGLGVLGQRHVVLHPQVVQDGRVLVLHVLVADLAQAGVMWGLGLRLGNLKCAN